MPLKLAGTYLPFMAITRAGKNLSDLLSLQYKENKGKFAASNGHLKAKSYSASGGFAP